MLIQFKSFHFSFVKEVFDPIEVKPLFKLLGHYILLNRIDLGLAFSLLLYINKCLRINIKLGTDRDNDSF